MTINSLYTWLNSTRTTSRWKSTACDWLSSLKWTKQSWSFHRIRTPLGSPIIASQIGPRPNESSLWDIMLTSGSSDDKATIHPLSKSNTSTGLRRELSRRYRTNISVALTGPSHQQVSLKPLTGLKRVKQLIWASNSLLTAHRSMEIRDVLVELWTVRFAMLRTMASCSRQITHTRVLQGKDAGPIGQRRLSESPTLLMYHRWIQSSWLEPSKKVQWLWLSKQTTWYSCSMQEVLSQMKAVEKMLTMQLLSSAMDLRTA